MPYNGSGVYSVPASTSAVSGDPISSSKYNTLTGDLAAAHNAPRPIVAGGTGATSTSAARTALGVSIGSDVQAHDAALDSLAGLTLVADKGLYATAADTVGLFDLTAAGRALLGDADASSQRTTLGLGDAAVAGFLDEDDLASDSDTAAPSQQSVKAYIAAMNPVKAWATFNGIGTPAVIAGSNIASITDNGTGDYTVTFTTAMASTNYAVILSCTGRREATIQNGNRVIANVRTGSGGISQKTTSSVRITTVLGATGTLVDVDQIYIQIIE